MAPLNPHLEGPSRALQNPLYGALNRDLLNPLQRDPAWPSRTLLLNPLWMYTTGPD